MQAIPVSGVRRGFGQTARRDRWWTTPALIFVGFSLFIVYATWAAFQNAHYTFGPYLSPFYSPEIFGASPHAWFGPKPDWWPGLLPFSPALIILPFPGLFRFTCYYYRGAYYKSFWADPPACAVGEPRKGYRGEHSFPLILQNFHRYFMWVAIVFIALLAWDVWLAMWFTDSVTGQVQFGMGVGTLVLAVNVVLLACYTWGCHVLRHVVGGRLNEVSKSPVCDFAYECVSSLNGRHQLFAWCSLFSVMSSDLYVRLCSMGVITDLKIF
ncbi:MAG: succinate dehydrogenase [Acidobacteria bacterium]|nr:succinate dehydrogenase [Acidobacteriota bacterium]